MFGEIFQPMHLVVILVVVLLIFGPGKLPELGKALGSGLRDFKKAVSTSDEEKRLPEEKQYAEVQKELPESQAVKKEQG